MKNIFWFIKCKRKVILKNDFIIKLNEIFYKRILLRLESFRNALEEPHSAIETMDPKKLKDEYNETISNCFDYIIDVAKDNIKNKEIEFINKIKEKFILYKSTKITSLLSDLNVASNEVLMNISNSTLGSFLIYSKTGLSGVAGVTPIPCIKPITAGIVSYVTTLYSSHTIEKHEQEVLSNWAVIFEKLMAEYDEMFGELCVTLDEIATKAPIYFHIDEEELDKYYDNNNTPLTFS